MKPAGTDMGDDSKPRFSHEGVTRRELAAKGAVGLAGLGTAGAAHAGSNAPGQPSDAPRLTRPSVLDFGADPKGRNDSSNAFRRAMQDAAGDEVLIPPGRYLVERLGGLARAGQKLVGSSRWNSILSAESGSGPIFESRVSAQSTSAFHLISDLTIDLNGLDRVGIDLASVNCSTIQRVHFRGRPGMRQGKGLRFAAPLAKGAYDNTVSDCSFEDLAVGIQWDDGANNNSVFNSRIANCGIGLHVAPSAGVDTPRVFGGRVEACNIGLLEGADGGAYFAIRFEGNSVADIQFTTTSRNAGLWGGLSASSRLVIRDLDKASSPTIESSDLGHFSIEESVSRPKFSTGHHVFGKPGKAPTGPRQRDYAVYFSDPAVFRNQVAAEFGTLQENGSIVGMMSSADDTLVIPGFDRTKQQYTTIDFAGGPAVRPLRDGTTDFGTTGRRYRALHLTEGVFVDGDQVIANRHKAIPSDESGTPSADRINQILAVLRHHGLIEE